MKKIAILTLAVIAMTGLGSVSANAQNIETFPSYIEVNGFAEKEVAPDVFYMRIEIREQDSKGKITLKQQQRNMISALKDLKIDTDKQLTRLSLSSVYYNKRTNFETAVYQLKLNNAEDVSNVVNILDELGISNVAFTKAEYSKLEELKNEVRQNAVRNAQQQAQSMASAIGQNIGKCFYMNSGYSTNGVLYAQPRMTKAVMYDAAANGAVEEEASIEFNNIKVSVNVDARFILE